MAGTDQANLTGKATLAETGATYIRKDLQSTYSKLAFPHGFASSVTRLVGATEMPDDDSSWLLVDGGMVPPAARESARLAFRKSECTNTYSFLVDKYLRNDVHSLALIHAAFRTNYAATTGGFDLVLEGRYTIGSLAFFSMFIHCQMSSPTRLAPHVVNDPFARRLLTKSTYGGLTSCNR